MPLTYQTIDQISHSNRVHSCQARYTEDSATVTFSLNMTDSHLSSATNSRTLFRILQSCLSTPMSTYHT